MTLQYLHRSRITATIIFQVITIDLLLTAEKIKRVLLIAQNISASVVDVVINFLWKSLPVVRILIARLFSAYIKEQRKQLCHGFQKTEPF